MNRYPFGHKPDPATNNGVATCWICGRRLVYVSPNFWRHATHRKVRTGGSR